MAGIKISALPAVPTALITDVFPVVQNNTTYKETTTQLISLLNSQLDYVPIAGGIMTGPLILSQDPTQPLMAVTKQYADAIAGGFTVILAAEAATTANLNAIQAGAGVGATLTNNGALAAFAVDGYSANLNDRILVKNQTLSEHNGVYTVTTVGSGAVAWVLTRATDYDEPTEIKPGTLIAVNNGTVNGTTSWLETATVVTVDTDPVLFSQFTFSPSQFLQRANNLSDLTNVATALVNLGLGTPTGTGNVVLQTSPTLITPNLGVATATSLQFSPTNSGIIGTTTNDNATSGKVGEYISSNLPYASAVACTKNVARDITSITLSAGDWDVSGSAMFLISGACTTVAAWTSVSSSTLPDVSKISQISAPSINNTNGLATPFLRVSINVNTTVYLSCVSTFTTGTVKASGSIFARRVR